MKHEPIASANALAVTGGVLYLVCAGWVMIARESFMSIFTYWGHSIDLAALPAKSSDLTSIVIGFITFTIAAWLTGYIFAISYNYFVKK